ncbi:MAG TPA: NUDIX domain-containing protein [Anaerolineales bacterium]|jgi:ADP-ribose pyrophosphatase YjhB (NUDIX family)|nr:NUDIX domain-containing protein [Anaerolineales bacterium]HNQ94106.1 NUDIX domain-containing protein [Anaerolineales bacterium]HNS59701.1 NUDIX domain-containing protein [Anaerolineales bacterium]
MAGLAVNVAVIHEGKILLTQREDFETWILPSGGIEDGESIAQAAIRETKEETGLDVELTRLVGVYSRLSNMSPGYMVLFVAKPIGGEIKCQEGETIAVAWFSFDSIPSPLSAGHKRRIEDAISGVTGVTVVQEFKLPAMPEKITRNELIELRDKSGLSRQDFYVQMFEQSELNEKVEVSGIA